MGHSLPPQCPQSSLDTHFFYLNESTVSRRTMNPAGAFFPPPFVPASPCPAFTPPLFLKRYHCLFLVAGPKVFRFDSLLLIIPETQIHFLGSFSPPPCSALFSPPLPPVSFCFLFFLFVWGAFLPPPPFQTHTRKKLFICW